MADARALVLALPNPVILIGKGGRIAALNDHAKDLIGAECEGWNYVMALRHPELLEAIEASLKDAEPRNASYLGNDGARVTSWDVNVTAVTLTDGRNVVLTFQDRTALEDADEMRRDFVANVSHEMRTPLTSLLGFIETLRGPARDDPAAQDRFLGIMEVEAGRMHRLVEDLLSLSRVEDQERIRPTEAVDLNTLIHEVLAALRPRADAGGVTLTTDLPKGPTTIPGDRRQLWQVISNLVENAIKYGAKRGTVTIRLTEPAYAPELLQTAVRLSVIDTGEGIAPHHIARLTERFYRIDTHRSREVGGTGLGLAIVKHIITRHRGRLKVESELGQGTEFTSILPANT